MRFRVLHVGLWLLLTATVSAQAPNPAPGPIEPFQADPQLLVTAQQGPYMILVSSFRGDLAGQYAQDLCRELREKYKMPAYLLRRVDEDAAAERDRIRKEELTRYGTGYKNGRKVMVLEDWAVLVGNYPDLKVANEELKRIKQLEKPKTLPIFSAVQEWTNPLVEKGAGTKGADAQKLQDTKADTFRKAFATRNPLAPKPQAAQADPRRQQMLGELDKHSVVHCKGSYTLVVMEFQAPTDDRGSDATTVFNSKFSGSKSTYRPDANHLANSLKLVEQLNSHFKSQGQDYEAFLLTTRASTLVTVGSFRAVNDPELAKAWQALKGQSVGGVKLLEAPYPCQVPKL